MPQLSDLAIKFRSRYEGRHVKNAPLVMNLILSIAKKMSEKNRLKFKEKNKLSDIVSAIDQLESKKSVLEGTLHDVQMAKCHDISYVDDLKWKIADINVAIKINKDGGLSPDAKSLLEMKSSLIVTNHEVDRLDKIMRALLRSYR